MIACSVLVRGFFGERFTADSTFTFRFTEDNYNSYANNGWLWSPSSAATIVKLSVSHLRFCAAQKFCSSLTSSVTLKSVAGSYICTC
jgi:hypothetical protein